MKHLLLAVLISIFVITVGVTDAFGCSCSGVKSAVLDEFEGANLVVITKLVSVDMTGVEPNEFRIPYGRTAKMLVERVYKGNIKAGDILTFRQGNGVNCGATYSELAVGSRYLSYLAGPTPTSTTAGISKTESVPIYALSFCGRSGPIKDAKDDLAYLDNIEEKKGKTRLSGTIRPSLTDGGAEVSNLAVEIVGNGRTFQTRTDDDGLYEIYDLPAGAYLVRPTFPLGWRANRFDVERSIGVFLRREDLQKGIPITIKPGRHTALDLSLERDGSVSGRVISPDGRPMKNVQVSAVSADRKEGDYRGLTDYTDQDGRYLIETIWPGRYRLVVNRERQMTGRSPFKILFYPGVSQFKHSATVQIDAGTNITGADIRVPETAGVIVVSGYLLFADGRPVEHERVRFKPDKNSDEVQSSEQTEEDGFFSIPIVKGTTGTIVADMYTSVGMFGNCPGLDNLIRKKGGRIATFETNTIRVTGEADIRNVRLKFPFPSCGTFKKANSH